MSRCKEAPNPWLRVVDDEFYLEAGEEYYWSFSQNSYSLAMSGHLWPSSKPKLSARWYMLLGRQVTVLQKEANKYFQCKCFKSPLGYSGGLKDDVKESCTFSSNV